MAELEGAGDDANDVVMKTENVGIGTADVGRIGDQAENPVGLVVHHRNGAIAGHGQHTVAHAVDHVAKEPVAHGRHGGLLSRRPTSGLRALRTRVGRDGAQAIGPSLRWHQWV